MSRMIGCAWSDSRGRATRRATVLQPTDRRKFAVLGYPLSVFRRHSAQANPIRLQHFLLRSPTVVPGSSVVAVLSRRITHDFGRFTMHVQLVTRVTRPRAITHCPDVHPSP